MAGRLGLGAVEPDGGGVLDSDGEGALASGVRGGRDEAGEETTVEGNARLSKAGLRNCVVQRVVVELDVIANLSDGVVGRVGETALTDIDAEGLLGGGNGGAGDDNSVCEVHCDWFYCEVEGIGY